MTPNVNYFELIEDYCQDQLDATTKAEFEAELEQDAKLRNEVKLRKEIQSAISELDVTNLREKLENVITQHQIAGPLQDTFDLFTDFTDFQEINEELSAEDLINFYDSMPKVHVYQHEVASNETIHRFYKEQEIELEEDINGLDDLEVEDLPGLEDAILEKDIIDFRQTLKQVAKSVEPQYTVKEIDEFLNEELEGSELEDFERELAQNNELNNELLLHKELEKSVKERDIIDLRNQVSQIMETETSWKVSEQDIEDFIEGKLEGEVLSDLETELFENQDLAAEIELRRQINEFIGESDIMELREELNAAKEFSEVSTVRKLIPSASKRIYQYIRTGAAVIVIVLGIASLLNSGYVSHDKTHDNFFSSPQWAPERSVNVDHLQQVKLAFMKGDHNMVLALKEDLPKGLQNDFVLNFYSAVSMHNLEKYSDAIANYSKVIDNGDNMYIEEAEWYRSLCYVKLNDKVKAKQELLAIVNKNGDYKHDAKAVLRRIKFSMK